MEFEMKEIVELFLVLILGVMILFFVVGGGGQLGGLWDKFCEWQPQLCEGGDTAIEFKMSEQSSKVLLCAINAVIRGDKSYCDNYNSKSSLSSAADSGSLDLGLSARQVEKSDSASLETDASVSCVDVGSQSIGKVIFAAGGDDAAKEYCMSTCGDEDCQISLDDGKTFIEHYVSQKEKSLIECTCKCDDGQAPSSTLGLIGKHVEDICQDRCGERGLKVYDCKNIEVDLSKAEGSLPTYKSSIKSYNEILDKNHEIIYTKGKRCVCKNTEDESDQQYVYGSTEDFAGKMCSITKYTIDYSSCEDFEGEILFYKENDILSHSIQSPKYECDRTIKTIKCTVKDFKLPQKVSDVQTYVINYGDPKFLLYYNMFPIEENTWTFKPDWKVHALIAAVSMMPPSKVFGAGLKMGWAIAKRTAVKTAFSKFKENLMKIVTKRFTLKGVIRMGAKVGFLETAVHTAALVDSISDNYVPHGNNMVLKSPFENAQLFPLEEKWEGKPVMVKWKRSSAIFNTNGVATAHLVSPCYLKYFDVYRTNIQCIDYVFDSAKESVVCKSPDVKDMNEDDIICGVFDRKIDNYIGYDGIYDKMTYFLKMDNKKLFEHEKTGSKTTDDKDIMKIKKIYLPHKILETGEIYYIADITLKKLDEKIPIPCGGGIVMSDIYSANLYHGDVKEREIEMNCEVYRYGGDSDLEGPCYIRDDYVSKEPFEYFIINRELSDKTKVFYSQELVSDCDVRITLTDDDLDGVWDSLGARSDDKFNSIVLSDIDDSGNFNNIATSETVEPLLGHTGDGCYMQGVVIDLDDVSKKGEAAGVESHNYCVLHIGGGPALWRDLGRVGAVVGGIAAIFVSGPLAFAIIGITVANEAASEISADYKGAWPGQG